jgi:hypothetical protein
MQSEGLIMKKTYTKPTFAKAAVLSKVAAIMDCQSGYVFLPGTENGSGDCVPEIVLQR